MELKRQDYRNIRGFNYVPSYSFILNDTMDHFDEQVWDREFGYAQMLNANSLRIWVSHVSYHRDPARFIRNFEIALRLAEKYGLTIMPVLYNRWVDANYPFGALELPHALAANDEHAEHIKYVRNFVSAFRYDPRIIMWDVCNEPYGYFYIDDPDIKRDLRKRETVFFKRIFDAVRDAKPVQPVTIGLCEPLSMNDIDIFAYEDVISCHPYTCWQDGQYEKILDDFIEVANKLDKPLLVTETCSGSLNDSTRKEIIEKCLGTLLRKGIGWYAWMLCAGEMVSGRRDRTDNNAPPGDRGYLAFVLENGSIRPGHEIVRELNKQRN
jgi:hypothetical protein